ncbi:MAG TPA: FtsX-like permease family protein [Thermoanaerobaculia bacterium]|jgi:predicted lysophospholipase L1 biosynthesis ABC-type transport system permease subunit|nr:FtsX-like permease family protein [Thermoanaerobaculia bacterium]
MIARLVLASLRRRFRQLALILAAVTVAAATVATLAGFSSRAGKELGESLSAFGPNLVVRPQVGGPAVIPASALARVREVPGVLSAAGVTPAVPASFGEQTAYGLDRIEVRAASGRLAEAARGIESKVEGVEAVPLLRVSESDARLIRRLTLILAAVSAVSLLLALLSVGAATTALLGERRGEIGLLLALGYTGRRIGIFLSAELLAAAVLAGALGEILGELAAGGLARRLLGAGGAGPSLTWGGFAAAAVVATLVVGSSMLIALRRVERLDAARILRGE